MGPTTRVGGTASTWITRDSHPRPTRALLMDMNDEKELVMT